MMSIILLLPVSISTDRSTDQPCALDMCNTTRSFTHESNTCVISRLAFLNLVFIDLLSCAPLLPQPRIAELWVVHEPQNLETARWAYRAKNSVWYTLHNSSSPSIVHAFFENFDSKMVVVLSQLWLLIATPCLSRAAVWGPGF